MKRFVALFLTAVMILGCFACGTTVPAATNTQPAQTETKPAETKTEQPAAQSAETKTEEPAAQPAENLSPVQQIIKEAQGMTLEELAKKAIEESNGKKL